MELTATQKIRQALTGDPNGEPTFQHEGAGVVRWITGGTLPDAYATFHHQGEVIKAKCPTCDRVLGYFPANYSDDAAQQLVSIRLLEHKH